jgi:hypothetical protein
MTTRAVIGFKTAAKRFKGVFHLQHNDPWVLGDHLLSRVIGARGDIDKVVEEVVTGMPWGWVSLPYSEQNKNKKGGNRKLFSQATFLKLRKEEVFDWIYIFDTEARTLTISDASTVDGSGIADNPFATVNFSDRGRPDPRQIVAPPPKWPTVAVAQAWEDDLAEWVPGRQQALDTTDAWCGEVELDPDQLAMLVAAALQQKISAKFGDDTENVWVAPEDVEGQTYWSVDLHGTVLHYPSPAWRESLRESGKLLTETDRLELWAPHDTRHVLDFSPRSLVQGYDAFDWPFEHITEEDTVAAVLRGVAKGLYPASDIDSEDLRVFRWMKVVEEVADPECEVQIIEDNPQAALGEDVQNTLLFHWRWDLLDWLRTNQLMETEEA